MVVEGFISFKLNGQTKFQIKWSNKQNKALLGDIIKDINRLILESDYDKVNVIDVNTNKINKLKQGVDLVFTSKPYKSEYDDAFENLLVDIGRDYSDLL